MLDDKSLALVRRVLMYHFSPQVDLCRALARFEYVHEPRGILYLMCIWIQVFHTTLPGRLYAEKRHTPISFHIVLCREFAHIILTNLAGHLLNMHLGVEVLSFHVYRPQHIYTSSLKSISHLNLL